MNASRRYLPLSLMLLLAASVSSANAGSLLDPYSHIKAPQGTAPKKRVFEKEPVIVPRADEYDEPQTFVNKTVRMDMDHLAESDGDKKAPTGILGKMTGSLKAGVSGVSKSGKMLANGAKAGTAKSASVVGSGIKSTGSKIKDSKDAVSEKIASKPDKKEKGKKSRRDSANKIASVDDWYVKGTADIINKNDSGKHAAEILKKDPSKGGGLETAFLPSKNSKKSSKFNPFNKFKKPGTKGDGKLDIQPASGFADGAANPDEEVLAELEREKAAKLAAKDWKEGDPNEKFTPIVSEPAAKKTEKVASKKTEKKSKLGGLSIAKFKPGMPSFGKKGKKSEPTSIAANHKSDKKNASELDKLTEVEPVAKIDPAGIDPAGGEEEDIASATPTFHTGDKRIDSVKPKTAAEHKPAVIAKKKEKKGSRFAGMGVANLSKFNFLNKKKDAPAQTATKSDAAKQM